MAFMTNQISFTSFFTTASSQPCGGPILRKRKHPALPLDAIDPTFNCQFDESKHGELLRETLDVAHLKPDIAERLVALVKKY